MGPYIYTPVTKLGEIRLIELQPSPNKGAGIQCCLIHTSFSAIQGDHYTALSYVWDPATD